MVRLGFILFSNMFRVRGKFLLALFLPIHIAIFGSFSSEINNNPPSDKIDESSIYRLPDDAIPTHYVLKVKPDLEASNFEGIVDISIQIVQTTNKLKLFSEGLTVTNCKITIHEKPTNCTHELDQNKGLLIISNTVQLMEGMNCIISLRYTGKLNDEMVGFYKSSYEEDGVKKWLMITNFEPTHARQAFPCFDEPRFKTSFLISIARKTNQKAISNMPIRKTVDDDEQENIKWDIFDKTPPIPAYLVGFLVSEMSSIKHSHKINIWIRKDIIRHIDYAIKQSHRLMKFYEEFTNLPYQLPKLDIFALPDLKKEAIHMWGITVFKERNMILHEDSSSLSQKLTLTRTISHQLSYLWFGNLITPTKWDYLWLREGFAKYFEYYAIASVESKWNLDELFVLEVQQSALWKETIHPRALTTSVTLPSHLESVYDEVSHEKAASILKMLEHIMTPKSFKAAIQNFLKRSLNKLDIGVTPNHFFQVLEDQVAADSIVIPLQTTITQVVKSWTENIGYPIISTYLKSSSDEIYFYQKRVRSHKIQLEIPANWIVPLTCTTKSLLDDRTTFDIWIYNNSMFESPMGDVNEWILCNLQNSGYYRIDYTSENIQFLIKILRENPQSLPPLVRAQLIDNAFAISTNLTYNQYFVHPTHIIPFELAHALENDTNVIPWIPAIFHLHQLWWQYGNTPYNSELANFIIETIHTKILNHIGFDVKETDDILTKKARTAIFSQLCLFSSSAGCHQPINEYRKNSADISKVHPDLKEVVYCAALGLLDDPYKVWNDLWSLYERTEIPYDRITILKTFACARNETLVQWTLARMVNRVPAREHAYIIDSLAYTACSTTGALRFLRDNIITSRKHGHGVNTIWKSILISVQPKFQIVTHYKLLEEMDIRLRNAKTSDYIELHKSIFEARKISLQCIRENYWRSYVLMYIIGLAIGEPVTYVNLDIDEVPKWIKIRNSGVASTPTFVYVFLCSLAVYYNTTFHT